MDTPGDRIKLKIDELKYEKLKMTDADKLKLYGLYKQATLGNAKTKDSPGWFDFTGQAKYDSWRKNKGMSSEHAEQQYYKYIDYIKTR